MRQTLDVPDEYGVLAHFGRDLRDLSSRQRRLSINRAFHYWRARGFPFPSVFESSAAREYHALRQLALERVIVGDQARPVTVGLRLANAFHPQMWTIRQHGRSPLDCFSDDRILRRCLEKCIQFYPHRRCWNAQCIRSVMRFYHRARVANFRPAVARALYQHYSNPGAVILDFAAGFGGRMLGSLSLERHYIGIDPAPLQIRGLTSMAKKLRPFAAGTAELHRACAEDFLPSLAGSSVDLIFSSPPYFNAERYSDCAMQSYRRYPHYGLWKEGFLYPVLTHAHRILRKDGYFILNVANLPQYKIADDVLSFAPRFFQLRRMFKLLMNTLPQARASGDALYRSEPIFVFQNLAK